MLRLIGHIFVSCGVIGLFGAFLSAFSALLLTNPIIDQYPLLRIPAMILNVLLSLIFFYITLFLILAFVSKVCRIIIGEKREDLTRLEIFLWNISEVCLDIVYNVSRLIFIHSPFPAFLYRLFGLRIGKNVGVLCRVYGVSLVTVGANSMLGTGSFIKPYSLESGKLVLKPIQIGKDVVIGGHSYISAGAHFEDKSVLAVGSMVPEDAKLESGWIYAGVPAKKIRELNNKTNENKKPV